MHISLPVLKDVFLLALVCVLLVHVMLTRPRAPKLSEQARRRLQDIAAERRASEVEPLSRRLSREAKS